MTLTLHFESAPIRDRFIILAHGMGLHGKATKHPGAFRYKVVTECGDQKTRDALTLAWSKITTERR